MVIIFTWNSLNKHPIHVYVIYRPDNLDEEFDENEEGSQKSRAKKVIKSKSKSETIKDTKSLSILNFFAQKPKKRNYSTVENSEFLIKRSLKFLTDF